MTSAVLTAPELSQVSKPKPHPAILEQVLFYGIFGLLLFGPVAFGAVDSWAIFVLESGTTVLFVLWVAQQSISGEVRIIQNPLFPPMLSFAAVVLLALITGRSAYPQATFSAVLLYCAYGMICFLTTQCLRRASQAKKLALIFSVYGSALAFFALIQGISPNGKVYWLREPRLGAWIYGPYVNHNHYAGLMEMLVPIPLVFCFTRYAWGTRKNLAATAAAIMASTVFLSGSRGGMLALTLELVLFAVIVITREKSLKATLTMGAVLLLVAGILTWVGGAEVAKRLATIRAETRTELSGGMRLTIDRDALRMFSHRPLLGWGLGTFPVVYPQFRSFYSHFSVNAAHNDYLQLLAETGVLGFATMTWFLVVLYRSSIRKLRDWQTNINGAVTLAALLGCVGILVHSFLDFNLQIPANAALFYVLCVVATSEPLLQPSRRWRSHATDAVESAISLIPEHKKTALQQ